MITILDTNAVIKMLYGKNMSSALKSFYSRNIQLAYHEHILQEYVKVAERLGDVVPQERATAFFVLLQELGLEISQLGECPILSDRDDEIFVRVVRSPELFEHKVVLVTDNQRDYSNAEKISMMTFREFTNQLRE